MINSRRRFIGGSGAVMAAAIASASYANTSLPRNIKAIAFDGFPIFDPRPIYRMAETYFPGHGAALSEAWRTKQYEYTWLRTVMGRYQNFLDVISESLTVAAAGRGLDLKEAQRASLVAGYTKMNVWPDVMPALAKLRAAGIRLAFLNDFSPGMLKSNISHACLEGLFEFSLSTDAVRAFKPSPLAYQMGVDEFGLQKKEILFVAFGGWDAIGAKSFGYPAFWLNRLGQRLDSLDYVPDGVGAGMTDLLSYLGI